jgi:hypothetical protein
MILDQLKSYSHSFPIFGPFRPLGRYVLCPFIRNRIDIIKDSKLEGHEPPIYLSPDRDSEDSPQLFVSTARALLIQHSDVLFFRIY